METNKPANTQEPTADSVVAKMIYDSVLRKEIVTKSFYWFFHYYFFAHVKYQTAEFQKEIFNLAQNGDNETLVITAFRGSGKTTIITQAYVIWAIIGMLQKKYVVILTQTMEQARALLVNVRYELENNPFLRLDLGPFKEETGEWRSSSLVLNKYNAKITVASIEQGIRGTKYGANRPDLIIADDLEDINSVRTKESRDKIYTWLMGDVMHLGDRNTKIIIVGNLLHQDSVMMRLKTGILDRKIKGTYRQYPAIYLDKNGVENSMWPGKYPTIKDVKSEFEKTGDMISYAREMLLQIIDDSEPIVDKRWLTGYSVLPNSDSEPKHRLLFTAIAIDPAIGQRDNACRTAIVSAKVYETENKEYKTYILPHPINKHLTFPQTIDKVKELVKQQEDHKDVKIFVEEVAYQASLTQQLKEELNDDSHVEVIGVNVAGNGNKRERLISTTNRIQKGLILFPFIGAEELREQITDFNIVTFVDLADAFSLLVNAIIVKDLTKSYTEPCCMIIRHARWHKGRFSDSGSRSGGWGKTFELRPGKGIYEV